jgi:hypothetical protein
VYKKTSNKAKVKGKRTLTLYNSENTGGFSFDRESALRWLVPRVVRSEVLQLALCIT